MLPYYYTVQYPLRTFKRANTSAIAFYGPHMKASALNHSGLILSLTFLQNQVAQGHLKQDHDTILLYRVDDVNDKVTS